MYVFTYIRYVRIIYTCLHVCIWHDPSVVSCCIFFALQDSNASTPLSTNEQGLSSSQVSAPSEVPVCAYGCAECATVCSGGCGSLRHPCQFPGKPRGEELVLFSTVCMCGWGLPYGEWYN